MGIRRLRSTSMFIAAAGLSVATFSALSIGDARAQTGMAGRAYGVYIDVPSLAASAPFASVAAGPLTFCDSGNLPPLGGNQSVSWANYSFGPYLSADTMGVVTSSDECSGSSSVHLVNTTVLVGHPAELFIASLSGDEEDDCCLTSNQPDLYAVQGLTIGGTPIASSGALNETVMLPGLGRVILNEVVTLTPDDCDEDDFLVNAIHLFLDAGGEVIIGSSYLHSDDDCCPLPARSTTWGAVKSIYR